jgi:hypothetical protein
MNNLTSVSGKMMRTYDAIGYTVTSTKNIDLKDGKDKNVKNFKITNSV